MRGRGRLLKAAIEDYTVARWTTISSGQAVINTNLIEGALSVGAAVKELALIVWAALTN
jgi:hypothetical protein